LSVPECEPDTNSALGTQISLVFKSRIGRRFNPPDDMQDSRIVEQFVTELLHEYHALEYVRRYAILDAELTSNSVSWDVAKSNVFIAVLGHLEFDEIDGIGVDAVLSEQFSDGGCNPLGPFPRFPGGAAEYSKRARRWQGHGGDDDVGLCEAPTTGRHSTAEIR